MRVLFVCLGNICRSPLAEGVFLHEVAKAGLAGRIAADSAGTGNWHAGDAPDRRSIAVAARHGIDISGQRARQVTLGDFERFDLILGMDRANLRDVSRLAGDRSSAQVDLFLRHGLGADRDVADPYHGEEAAFETAYRDILAGCEALVARLAVTMSRDRS